MTRQELTTEMEKRRPHWLPGEEALIDPRVGKNSWYAMTQRGTLAGLRIFYEEATGQAVLRDFLRPSTIYQSTTDIAILRTLLDITTLREETKGEKIK